MPDMRHKDADWAIGAQPDGGYSWAGAQVAVLMDLRDELKQLNRVLACASFQRIPGDLAKIRQNTTKKKRWPKKPRPKKPRVAAQPKGGQRPCMTRSN